MAKNDSNSGPEPPEQADPLTATAMFLKAFEPDREGTKKAPDPFFADPVAPRPNVPAPPGADRPVASEPPFKPAASPGQPSGPGSGPGEFTQMFNTLGARQTPASAPKPARETPPVPQSATAVVKGPPQPPSDPGGGGEFTRIFVSGSAPAAHTPPAHTPPARPAAADDSQRPAPSSLPSSRSKGFSSPGTSDSASAGGGFTQPEGGFTQMFNMPSVSPSPRPAVPVQSSESLASSSSADRGHILEGRPVFQAARQAFLNRASFAQRDQHPVIPGECARRIPPGGDGAIPAGAVPAVLRPAEAR